MDTTLRDIVGAANALSAAAGLVMGKISRTPAAIIRGFAWQKTESNISMRLVEKDLFL
jgi:F420-0:gamma-glutamyl ligase